MATVEIEESELEALKKSLGLLNTLATGTGTRREFQKLLKTVQPDLRTEDDIATEYAAPLKAELDTVKSEFETFKTEQAERLATQSNDQALAALQSKFVQLKAGPDKGGMGFTDEGIEKLKQHMVDTQTPDPFVAAAHYVTLNPPAKSEVPSAWEPDSYGLRETAVENDVAGLFKNEDLWSDKMVSQVLNESRQPA